MKKSKYLMVIKKDDVYLLYNSLYIKGMRVYNSKYKELIDQLEEIGYIDYDDKDTFHSDLKENRMIVENDVNEENIVNYRFSTHNNSFLLITMFVTRQCNFRCPYCYEEHQNLRMTDKILDSTKNFIEKLIQERNYKNVHISWFGGEPTLEVESICKFMDSLKQAMPDIYISGSTTTNAYLLDKDTFLKLYDAGVTGHQITIDGLSSTHDKTRVLYNGKGTWNKIMKQLKEIKALGPEYSFNIKLRTNFTREIIENAEVWLSYLYNNFGDDRRFLYHFEAVKNLGGDDNGLHLGINEEANAISKVFEIAGRIGIKLDLNYAGASNFSICCYASKPNAFAIDYDGTIMKCTVSIDEEINKVGKISSDGTYVLDETKTAWWTSYTPGQKCIDCEIYPLCYGRKCPYGYNPNDTELCMESVAIYRNGIEELLMMTVDE